MVNVIKIVTCLTSKNKFILTVHEWFDIKLEINLNN